jgi:DNA-binding beta-propeller fold protein YncE
MRKRSVAYPVGTVPFALAFDGANMWVANQGSNNVTKLLASTGAIVGTYAAGAHEGEFYERSTTGPNSQPDRPTSFARHCRSEGRRVYVPTADKWI